MSACAICGQRNVDGAIDGDGDYVCVDCWSDGAAAHEGRTATSFVAAPCSVPVVYPADMQARFLDACNRPKGRT